MVIELVKSLESKIDSLNTEITKISNNPNSTHRDEARSYRLLLEMMNTTDKINHLKSQHEIFLQEVK